MGTAGRLSHHAQVSRRRAHRRKPVLRRVHRWPTERAVTSTAEDTPSRFLTPLTESRLAPEMVLSPTAGEVRIATVIEADAQDPVHEPSVLDLPQAQLSWRDPLHWLVLGWRDFRQAPLIGLFYGACFVLMGWLLLACFEHSPEYTLALSAGFLLVGPFLCLGLYEASRRMARGEPASFWSSLTAWRISRGQLAVFAGVLLVLEMLWGRAAMIVFAISFDGVPDFSGPLSSFFSGDMLVFLLTYMAVGALFAGLIYAISVISMPMIMDRSADAISAGLSSMRLVLTQPLVMWFWAALIAGLVIVAMLPGFAGLLIVGPVVGHASWHAYQAAMGAAQGDQPA